jgi:hypothetical protein
MMDIERVNHVLGKAIVGLQGAEIERAAELYVDETVTVPRSIEVAPVTGSPEPQAQGRKSRVGSAPSSMK